MTTTVPPSDSRIAAPDLGTATMRELWQYADESKTTLSALLRVLNEDERGDVKHVS